VSGEAERYARGRAAWPEVALPGGAAAFAQYLLRHHPTGVIPASLHVEDLYLAGACAAGCDAGLLAFERRYLSQVDHFLPPGDRTPTFLDELRQTLRDKLLVGRDGALPKIADYSGRGSLHSWVRTVAVHAARNLHRANKSELLRDPSESAMQALASSENPEFNYLKRKYQKDFKEAFESAFASLPTEQREVLRLHYVEGLNIDNIGLQLQVNRATVARWRNSARQAVLDETRRQLRQRLQLTDSEFVSVARLLRSQIDVSLARLLRKNRTPV